MIVEISCPKCDTKYRLEDDTPTRKATCKKCGESFTLESLSDQTQALQRIQPDQPTQATRNLAANAATLPSLLGRFQVRGKLGAGAFGVVYRAYDPLLDREVALKVPHAGALANEKDKARYLREPKAAAQLRHPSIVPVFEVGLEGENLYLASAFIEGETLQDATRVHRPSLRRTATLVMKLAEALDYAHTKGIVHRDIKPANIMLDANDEPLVMDFGLARIQESADQLTHDGAIMGTPAYMSPEQARGDQTSIGPASDQYALGVVMYELLCGARPFNGPPSRIIALVQNEEPPPLSNHGTSVPKDLETICMKSMSKETTKRYASCREMAADLRRWLDDMPIHARRLSLAERMSRWCKRNPAIAGLAAAVCFVLFLGISLTTWKWLEADEERRIALGAKNLADQQTEIANENADAATKSQKEAEDNLLVARKNLYVAHMNWVQNAWDDGLGSLCQELLDAHLPQPKQEDLRGFEWYYLKRICRSPIFDFTVVGPASSVALSPDGKSIAMVSNVKSFYLWEMETRKSLQSFEGHTEAISQLAFSPNGQRIASASRDKTIRVWDAASGMLLHTLSGHAQPIEGIAFSHGGKQIVSICADEVRQWDVETGENLKTFRGGGTGISLSSDGERFITIDETEVKVRDAETGDFALQIPVRAGTAKCVAMSPDGAWIATGYSSSVQLWNAKTAQPKSTLTGHDGLISSLAFSPDSKRIASAANDKVIRLWDVASGMEQFKFTFEFKYPCTVALSSDAKRIAGTSGSIVRAWELPPEAGEFVLEPADPKIPIEAFKNNVGSVAFSPDGRQIASATNDKNIALYDVETKQLIRTLEGHGGNVQCVAYSPDEKHVASASSDNTIIIWDVKSGNIIRKLKGHTGEVAFVAYNTDGTKIVSASFDKTIRTWDTATGDEIRTFNGSTNQVFYALFSPDDRRIVSADHTRVRIWDAEKGIELLNLEGGVMKYCCAVFSPDGQQLAIADRLNVKLCDAQSGEVMKLLSSHTAYVKSMAYSPDGKRLITSSMDKTIKVWNPSLGALLLTLNGHANSIESVAFNLDGSLIASAGVDGSFVLWNGQPMK